MAEKCNSLALERWRSTIPICFILSDSSIGSSEIPFPFFIQAQRCSYLSVASRNALEVFLKSMPECVQHPFFESNGLILNEDVPVGCLHDFIHQNMCCALPWVITIRFSSVNSLEAQNSFPAKERFFSSVKQALTIMSGSARKINILTKKARDEFWDTVLGARNQNLQLFWDEDSLFNIKTCPLRILHCVSCTDHPECHSRIKYRQCAAVGCNALDEIGTNLNYLCLSRHSDFVSNIFLRCLRCGNDPNFDLSKSLKSILYPDGFLYLGDMKSLSVTKTLKNK